MNISVIIPTFNRVEFLKKAIESVLSQTLTPKEVIVIDDGSTDQTQEVVKDLPVKYFFKDNKGVSAARNLGIEKAQEQWIAFLDSDDVWKKQKLEKQVAFHKTNNFLISQTEEQWIRNSIKVNKPKKYLKKSGDLFRYALEYCCITPSSVLIHKKIFEDVGVFDESLLVCEDYDLWLRITQKYKIGLIEEELIEKIAGHKDQLSFTTPTMDYYRLKALEKHLQIEEVKETYNKKKKILINGAKKHKNLDLLKLLIP